MQLSVSEMHLQLRIIIHLRLHFGCCWMPLCALLSGRKLLVLVYILHPRSTHGTNVVHARLFRSATGRGHCTRLVIIHLRGNIKHRLNIIRQCLYEWGLCDLHGWLFAILPLQCMCDTSQAMYVQHLFVPISLADSRDKQPAVVHACVLSTNCFGL